ncbi:MAG: GNAT family N-acetyltransferase [Bacteroidota bacterium]|nr:GNAT family N-acetyltransferase [Bacteroidota bacterium]
MMNHNKIQLIKIDSSDIEELQELSKQTFFDAFSLGNSDENIQAYLKTGFAYEKLAQEIDNVNSEFYFAKTGGKLIGYLKINSGDAQTEFRDNKGLEIERIYVLHDYQGKKAGQILQDKAIEIANHKHADYIWLGVWEKNPRAINFYKKNRFVQFDKHFFKVGNDEQTDILMKLVLRN